MKQHLGSLLVSNAASLFLASSGMLSTVFLVAMIGHLVTLSGRVAFLLELELKGDFPH